MKVVKNQGFYSQHRKSLEQNGWLQADNALLKQQIAAITPFFVPLVLILLWLAQRGTTSTAILVELIATLAAALFVGSHQIRMTPGAYSRFKQIRAQMRQRLGVNLQRGEIVMAFAVLGYSALNGTELERFATYRNKEQSGD